MKRWNNKLLAVWVIAAAVAGVGCASTKTEAPPPMPSFETEQQVAAAHDCQSVYSCCTRACMDKRSAQNAPTAEHEACLAACRSCLDECYRGCE